MRNYKLFGLLAACSLLASCGGPQPSVEPSPGASTPTASTPATPSTPTGPSTPTDPSTPATPSTPTPSTPTPSTPATPSTPTPGGNTNIPSVTTPKDMTTVYPNHTFAFSYNSTTENNVSDTYIKPIVELDATDYADICQVEVVLDINFGGQNNAMQYYGGEFGMGYEGNTHTVAQWGDGSGFWNYSDADATSDGAYSKGTLHLWFDVNGAVSEYDQLYLVFTYAAKSTFNVVLKEMNFVHTEGYTVSSSQVTVNKTLLQNYSQASEVLVPLNQLSSTNPYSYFDLNLEYTCAEDYAGGVVWVEGVFNEGLFLPNAPRNSVNIGKAMTAGKDVKTVASVRVYLDKYVAVDTTGFIKLTCNWAPASLITVNSVTFYQLNGTSSGNGGGSSNIVLDDSFLSETQSPLEVKLGMDNIKTAMSNSLVSKGNNYLLKNAISKMQNGDNTTIAYIGGSITEGDNMPVDKITDIPGCNYSQSWAYWSYKFLAGKYGTGNNVKYHNAAMSGTGSDIGVARFQKDVLDFNPNIVFIEFAVNNGETQLEKESYESMIRMALANQNKPAVVLAMSWTGYSGGNVENYMTTLGQKYGLPVISIHKGLNQFKNQIFQYNYSDPNACFTTSDNLHPNVNGHKLYAKLVGYGITTIASDTTNDAQITSMPAATFSDRYQNIDLYQRGNSSVSVSGFDANQQTFVAPTNKSHQVSGQGGWQLLAGTGTLTLTGVNAKAVLVLYCANQYDGSNGTINVTVSGGHTGSGSCQLPKDQKGQLGWGNVCYISALVADSAESCNISVSLTGKGQIIGIAVAK